MKALIAMSGGVDSSVASLLTKEKGYDCIGCTMKLYDNDSSIEDSSYTKTCCSIDDVSDARSVAIKLGMPYYVFNYKDEFKEKVINNFVNCYLCGQTPNPCVECNRHMKFEKLLNQAKILGCDKIVTGHYARIEYKDGQYYLKKANDPQKDQSYVLYMLTQEMLSAIEFPLGEYDKEEARKIASEHGFVNANKKDSQDICFVPDGDYARVIEGITQKGSVPGDFVYKDGTVLGKHKGMIHYTIGQRKGLGIAYSSPLYVLELDTKNNRVILGSDEDLFKDNLSANHVNWISGNIPSGEINIFARIRYHAKEVPGKLRFISKDSFTINFNEKVRAITQGQSVVIYDGDYVLGGGIICS